MTWNVAIEVRNSAWLTWKKLAVEAENEQAAGEEAIRECWRRVGQWTAEHDDYCPQDWTFRVIGVVPA